MARLTKRTNRRDEAFLKAYELTGDKKLAAEQAGYSVKSIYRYIREDAAFAERVSEIEYSEIAMIEASALDLAVNGDIDYKSLKVFDKSLGKEVSKIVKIHRRNGPMMQYLMDRKAPKKWDKETIKQEMEKEKDYDNLSLSDICEDLFSTLNALQSVDAKAEENED
ncbi:hypothetical protein [Vibrio algivorus]|uniref:Terminase n=1 Tax=Vibrio algivorus TaxID=1667024 RepID=A0A557P6B9_9VIBR|nr:hypothetical protein [Vibrio algivorus]TVO36204.1 hypothetical protein FOF44_09845 [Vibrio algivorus]